MKVGPRHIKGVYTRMLDAGRSPSTVRRVAMLLHKFFEDMGPREGGAGIVVRNPVDFTEPPQNAEFEAHVWDEEQTRLFVGWAQRSSRFPEFWLLMVSTGLRLGEGLALRVRDVDTDFGFIHVRHALSRPRGGGFLFTPPKSKASRRIIAIPSEAAVPLSDLRSGRAAEGPDALLFVQPHGAPLRPKQVRADFRRVVKKAGLPQIRVHDVRHGLGSYLADQNVPLQAIAHRLGHSSKAFTANTYVHSIRKNSDLAANVASRLLRPAPHLHLTPGRSRDRK